jgi:hypothetical protein
MGSTWVKIAAAAVVVVVVIIVLGRLGGDKPASESQENDKTFYDMAERDKQFAEEPKRAEEPMAEPTQPPAAPPEPSEQPSQPPAAPVPGGVLPSSITQPTTLHFVPLEEIEDIQAQSLLPWATAGRSIGRLPMVQYGLMVKACRDMLNRWPDSWYAFRAKQMLEEITQYSNAYNITPQELDISRFLKPRRGSEPRTVEPVR